jgi:acyl-coenzyme A synthetase/AMP-(fatty) acid ligase
MLSISDMGPPSPCPAPFNLAAHVLQGGAAQPDRIALQILSPAGAERWSHARLTNAIRGTGTGLLERNLAPGDRLLLVFGNEALFAVAFLGAIAAGLIPVPVSSALTGRELARIQVEIRPAAILLGGDLPAPQAGCPVIPAADLARMEALAPCDWAMGDPERLAYMIYTSGTSGHPRAVMHAHRAVWARRMMVAGWTGLTSRDRVLHAGALPWTYTLGTGLLDPWAAGAMALLPARGTDPGQLGLLLKRHDATIFAGTPGHYRQILKAALPPLPRLRHGLSAGEALSDATRAAWQAATRTPVYEAFGMSECSTFLSGSPARPAPRGSSGYGQPGRRIAVLGPKGRPVPLGDVGTLAIDRRDPGLFLGYLDAREETESRFAGDWFLTGDSAAMAPDGAVTYLGREDDMMNAGGVRVSPLEVEAALATLPGLIEAAAAEVRVKADTTVIACFYTAAAPIADATLAAHAADRLARYKQPRLYIRVDAIPRGATNKILRRRLRHDWETAHGQA